MPQTPKVCYMEFRSVMWSHQLTTTPKQTCKLRVAISHTYRAFATWNSGLLCHTDYLTKCGTQSWGGNDWPHHHFCQLSWGLQWGAEELNLQPVDNSSTAGHCFAVAIDQWLRTELVQYVENCLRQSNQLQRHQFTWSQWKHVKIHLVFGDQVDALHGTIS